MLHDVLLALSGHPSPLFGDQDAGLGNAPKDDFPLLSPSEGALLRPIGRLSQLHRRLKRHLELISSSHQSIVARAVATSIEQTHLARFQKRILNVESKILKRDASVVGAYEIVPLATVVGEFDDWHRLMAWYWDIACFVLPPDELVRTGRSNTNRCTSALLIDKLRAEAQTGFPELEEAALEVSRVAEMAWLRHLSSWIVHGKLPSFGAQDFFIQLDGTETQSFKIVKELLPSFIRAGAAASVLFIGKSLHQVQHHCSPNQTSSMLSERSGNEAELASKHLQQLSSLSLPITPSRFSRAISEIRLSLSQNVLQHLLPMSKTLQVLSCLRHNFLLAGTEFATTLIVEASNRVQTRQQSMGRLLQQNPVKAMQGLSIKDAELNQTLQQVWKSLAAQNDDSEDQVLDYARQHISLSIPKPHTRPSTSDSVNEAIPTVSTIAFNDLLFLTPTELTLSVKSPLDLLLSSQDMEKYTAISSYLLAIRRGHSRLSELWRRTPARRDHPVSVAQQPEARSRNRKRATANRKIWATCSAAIFLLSETAAFFESEIIKGACDHFQQWVLAPALGQDWDVSTTNVTDDTKTAQRDPETLASAHRSFLAALIYALLLTDMSYTTALRSLLGNVDNLFAFFTRLMDIQQKQDLANGDIAHVAEEEQRTTLELDRARKKVDSDLKSVVNRLRQLDQERIGSLKYLDLKPGERGNFEVWKGGGVDMLLMKLESGRMVENGYEVV